MPSQCSTPPVTYKDVPGFPGYRVGDDGTLWSCRRAGGKGVKLTAKWRQVRGNTHKRWGHVLVYISDADGVQRYRMLHRLVLESFIGPCPPGMECCHGDGDPSNNRLSNLRWDTSKSNKADMVRHGTRLVGEKSNGAKYTAERVLQVREMAGRGRSAASIARFFHMKVGTVEKMVRGKTWKHLFA